MDFILRKAVPGDLVNLHRISCSTFSETFSSSNHPEDMRMYLEESMSPERLLRELENSLSEFFFIEVKGEVAGYLKLNYGTSQTDLQEENATEIERIYVLSRYHSMGLGKRLLNLAIHQAESRKSGYIWLGVWEHNTRAIEFYTRHGFVKFGEHPFVLGNDQQTDILMKRSFFPKS